MVEDLLFACVAWIGYPDLLCLLPYLIPRVEMKFASEIPPSGGRC